MASICFITRKKICDVGWHFEALRGNPQNRTWWEKQNKHGFTAGCSGIEILWKLNGQTCLISCFASTFHSSLIVVMSFVSQPTIHPQQHCFYMSFYSFFSCMTFEHIIFRCLANKTKNYIIIHYKMHKYVGGGTLQKK